MNVTRVDTKGVRSNRRTQILGCAKRVFSRKGFHNAKVADLIHQAGIARGTFYLYFTGKRDIFDTLLDELLQELRLRIQPIEMGPGAPAPLDQLKANVRRILELMTQEPDLFQILLRHASGLDQQAAAVLQTFYDRVLALIERSLEHGIRLGLIRPCDTQMAAICILGTIKEVAEWLTVQGRKAPDLDVLAEDLLGFGLRGVYAHRPGT